MNALRLVPCDLDTAKRFNADWHRHHPDTVGHKFSIGLAEGEELVGVIMVGWTKARAYQDGLTLEVNRCCVADGVQNGCSMLYAAAWRAAKALGYGRLITYTQADEPGTSLQAAGWRVIAERPGRLGLGWASRPRRRIADGVARTLWEAS